MGFGVNVAQITADDLAKVVARLNPSHVYLSFGDDVGASGHAAAVTAGGRAGELFTFPPP